MVEFDPINNFHMHGNMFYYTPSGTLDSSRTDVVSLMQGDRGKLEFTYHIQGLFMSIRLDVSVIPPAASRTQIPII